MKIEQVSEHIWSLSTWLLFPVRVWLVTDEEGITLVDAGMPYMAKKIVQQIRNLNRGELKRILLTHGHSDHIGSVKPILHSHNVPVFAHPIEIPYMEGQMAYPGRKRAEKGIGKQIVKPLPADANGRLTTIAGLTPYLTPGHSPGHVIYYHEKDKVILAGDLFTSKNGKLQKPMKMFTANMKEAIASSSILKGLDAVHMEICHGGPITDPGSQIDAYLKEFDIRDRK